MTECAECGHDSHEPGKCEVLFIYARGPTDPPGNRGCFCGLQLTTEAVSNDDFTGTMISLKVNPKVSGTVTAKEQR